MGAQVSAAETIRPVEARAAGGSDGAPVGPDTISAVALRVRAEYLEMPGLCLTVLQAARLFDLAPAVAHAVLDDLRRGSVLTCSGRGTYSLNR